MQTVLASIRVAAATILVAVVGYTLVVLGIANAIAPDNAQGSLIRDSSGAIVGSRLIAQKFTLPHYFWPRPSAVDYNGAGAGGSNKSPTNPDVAKRAAETVAQYGATPANPLPAELAAASGGGLDPHITERAALYQASRIATARGLPVSDVESLVRERAFSPGGTLTSDRLVNVLELNLELNKLSPAPASPAPPAGQ
jgi:K+-transporting ATPase ATPase C chain